MAANREPDTARARRYLLGTATDEESSSLEQEYFRDDAALEGLSAAEDDLIEDYLENRLTREEREQFDRAYAAPHRRARVETIRALSAGPRPKMTALPSMRSAFLTPFPLAAAAVLVLAVGAFWAIGTGRGRQAAPTQAPTVATAPNEPSGGATPASAPRVFAFAVSPVA